MSKRTGKPGPDKEYNSPAKLEDGVREYLEHCEKTVNSLGTKGVFPDYAGMLRFLGMKKRNIVALLATPERQEYEDILEDAMLARESWLARNMAADNKKASGCMNNLKQPINGGYTDRPMESGNAEIKINLTDIGGESAFK